MTAEELLTQALTLAKPCVHLTNRAEDGPLAAVWKGRGLVPVEAPDHCHWLSFDCGKLPGGFEDLNLTGTISVYANDEDCVSGLCECDPGLAALERASGQPLYARPATSLPSFCQLLRSGTPHLREWVHEIG